MSEHTTYAYNRCPRCKSGQIEATGLMYGENWWAVEHLHCNNCGLDFEQHYEYVCTTGEWDDDQEAYEQHDKIDLVAAKKNAYRRHGTHGVPTAHVYD